MWRRRPYTTRKIDSWFPYFVQEQIRGYLHQQVATSNDSVRCSVDSSDGGDKTYPTKRMLTAVSNSTDERFRSLSSPASRAAAMLLLFYRISQGRNVLGDLSQGEKGEIEKEEGREVKATYRSM